jgi:hypothetical protein
LRATSDRGADSTRYQRETEPEAQTSATDRSDSATPQSTEGARDSQAVGATLALIAEEGFIGYRSGEGAYILVADPEDSDAQALMAGVQRAITGGDSSMADRRSPEGQDRLLVRGSEDSAAEQKQEKSMEHKDLRVGQVVQVTGKMLSNGNLHAIAVTGIEAASDAGRLQEQRQQTSTSVTDKPDSDE